MRSSCFNGCCMMILVPLKILMSNPQHIEYVVSVSNELVFFVKGFHHFINLFLH
jgi:hypothetical protein